MNRGQLLPIYRIDIDAWSDDHHGNLAACHGVWEVAHQDMQAIVSLMIDLSYIKFNDILLGSL